MAKNFNSQDLIKKLEFYFDHGKNVLISGHKGIGKTAIITQVFNTKTKNWLYFSGATLDPWIDFIGVPKEKTSKDGTTTLEFIRPQYMNDEVEAIFIDEYNRSAKKIRNAVMELIQFKSLNGKKFPNLKVVWAGVNPYNPDDDENEIYDVEPIDPAQKDRFQIQIDLPYSIDEEFFINKFGKKWADGAVEWWNGLPDKIRKMVSPRRLDYALEIHQLGGEMTDVLPHESNPSKLLSSLGLGGLEKMIRKLFTEKDKESAVAFLAQENNYQSCCNMLVQDQNWANFFWPMLDEERQLSLFFGNKGLQALVFKDPIFYKNTLEIAEKNKLCEPDLLRKITHLLKKMRGISLDDFNDAQGIQGYASNNFVTGAISVSGVIPNYNGGNTVSNNTSGKGFFGDIFSSAESTTKKSKNK